MQKNLVFFSGPHGSGKSTLIDILLKEIPNAISPELKTKTSKFQTEPKERQIMKTCQRSIENYEYLEIAIRNPEKIILGNRCIYDVIAYNETYHSRKWIPKDELAKNNRFAKECFIEELNKPYAIILNPDLEIVKLHLEKRWKEKEKKWNENDMDYLKAACESYGMFKNNERIFYISKEINLDNTFEIKKIVDWIVQGKNGEK